METNNHLLEEISMLKSSLEQLDQQLQQMEEREQMLLQYPDFNGPIAEHEPRKILNDLLVFHIRFLIFLS